MHLKACSQKINLVHRLYDRATYSKWNRSQANACCFTQGGSAELPKQANVLCCKHPLVTPSCLHMQPHARMRPLHLHIKDSAWKALPNTGEGPDKNGRCNRPCCPGLPSIREIYISGLRFMPAPLQMNRKLNTQMLNNDSRATLHQVFSGVSAKASVPCTSGFSWKQFLHLRRGLTAALQLLPTLPRMQLSLL